jgi:hypothetical protein
MYPWIPWDTIAKQNYCAKHSLALLLPISWASQLALNVPVDAGFLYDKATAFGNAIKKHHVILLRLIKEAIQNVSS